MVDSHEPTGAPNNVIPIDGVTDVDVRLAHVSPAQLAGLQEAADGHLIIRLADLLPDHHGEIVLTAAQGPATSLVSDESVVQSGVVESHVTAAGIDVGGYEFYVFEHGTTVFVEPYEHFSVSSAIAML